jgi:hypothetical protein
MSRNLIFFSVLAIAVAGIAVPLRIAAQDAGRQEMSKLLPQPLPTGAVAQPVSFYTPDNLYEYMDGGADIFLVYGVRQVLHLDLRIQKADLTLDIFDMGTPDTAFGMYAAERTADEPFLSIGLEGYKNKGALNFLEDRYYVKLTGFGEGADAALEPLARAVSARIGGRSAFPALLTRLPTEQRKPHSEQYMPNEPLGHAFLAPAYVATYTLGGEESKLYVTLARDEADAQQRFKQLEQHFTKTGQSKPAPEIGESAIKASNSFEGAVIAEASGRYLILLANPAAGADELLKKTASALK